MDKNKLKMELEYINDIYSFCIVMFKCIQIIGERNTYKDYKKSIKGNAPTLNIISELIKNLYLISYSEIKNWIEIWENELEKSVFSVGVFCFATLIEIDNILYESLPKNKTIINKGPFNDNYDEYRFYYKMNGNSLLKRFEDEGIRVGRQILTSDPNSLNNKLKNFEIIKNTYLCDYIPHVREYCIKYHFSNSIKIGVSNFISEKWFKEIKIEDSKEFKIEYNTTFYDEQNNYIKRILTEFEEKQVNIAVFPELAMNNKTQNVISEFLINSDFSHLKLCFLGSFWHNNKNESVLISGQGTIISTHKKKCQYREYDKNEGGYYDEGIDDDKIIYFTDIEGLGRIVYLICADFNDDTVKRICSLFGTEYYFVSAYTNDTNTMWNSAEYNAKNNGSVTVLCNSCTAIPNEKRDKNYVAFCIVPKVCDKRLVKKIVHSKSPCYTDSCHMCNDVFNIQN